MYASFKFTNQGQHPISAVIFHEVHLNAVGEEIGPSVEQAKLMAAFSVTPDDRSEQTYVAKKQGLQPGETAKMNDNMGVYGRPMKGSRFMIYVRAVKFGDGTKWQDDGSHSCKLGRF